MNGTICPFCGSPAAIDNFDDHYSVICPICEQYLIDYGLFHTPTEFADIAPFVSAATRQASERGVPLFLRLDNVRKIAELHRYSTVSQKIDKLLHVIAARSMRPGNPAQFTDYDYPLADCENPIEIGSYFDYLKKESLIVSPNKNEWELTIKGWQVVEPTLRPGGEPGRCFVAMWFDDSMDEAFAEGFDPGIRDAGFLPYRVKRDPTNKGVSDYLLSEIRRAQFVVADFTGHHG